ncbi:Glutaminyl-tRNA synthase (glutamine-hydrolyzing) [Handroanthus impetiginosus]|uniref:Glutaminyl-tRNA synthase (Glutamine-hydrolyzing) n=1 Tax=Handroanthus impetiginosus TaxID=429701 RepID=A0A2G9I532_9LAMI|nr:Glutaminyl-tRNA synthase (glutamine-hydrolyzing) [Handroanthus impetiginosus]
MNRPMCRTVSDAVHVLDAIVGYDNNDPQATRSASKYIPHGGYSQFLKPNGLKGKRLGIVRDLFFQFSDKLVKHTSEQNLQTLRQNGAVLVDNLEIANLNTILDYILRGELTALLAEFKISLNDYLRELVASPVRSLAAVIAFNKKFSDVEKIKEFGQDLFLASEATNGIGDLEKKALRNLTKLTRNGFEKLMEQNKLDAIVTAGANVASVLAIGGFPGITVPAAYDRKGVPIGICFGGLKGFEPRLIEIAYAFEQATKTNEELNEVMDRWIRTMLKRLEDFSRNEFEKLMKEHELNVIITPSSRFFPILAIGGYPGITVPAGYGSDGMPFGIRIGGLKGTEPALSLSLLKQDMLSRKLQRFAGHLLLVVMFITKVNYSNSDRCLSRLQLWKFGKVDLACSSQ